MASIVKIKRSAVQGKAPDTSAIEAGELALNTRDGKLFSSSGNTVFEIGANLTSLSAGSITVANGSIRVGASNTVVIGTNATIHANNSISNGSITTAMLAPTATQTGTFGAHNQIPVITVNSKGQITAISNTDVGGVTNVQYQQANNNLAVTLANGHVYNTEINVQARATWTALLETNTAIRSVISSEVSGLIDSAPGSLDTLNELAAALNDDENFATTVTNSIATKATWSALTSTNTAIRSLLSLEGITNGGNTTPYEIKVGGLTIGSSNASSYTFPKYDGSSLQILQTDGSGNLAWVSLEAAEGGGFSVSTLSSYPTGDYAEGGAGTETYVGSITGDQGTDPFGVSLGVVYDCMDPQGRYVTEDLGALT